MCCLCFSLFSLVLLRYCVDLSMPQAQTMTITTTITWTRCEMGTKENEKRKRNTSVLCLVWVCVCLFVYCGRCVQCTLLTWAIYNQPVRKTMIKCYSSSERERENEWDNGDTSVLCSSEYCVNDARLVCVIKMILTSRLLVRLCLYPLLPIIIIQCDVRRFHIFFPISMLRACGCGAQLWNHSHAAFCWYATTTDKRRWNVNFYSCHCQRTNRMGNGKTIVR